MTIPTADADATGATIATGSSVALTAAAAAFTAAAAAAAAAVGAAAARAGRWRRHLGARPGDRWRWHLGARPGDLEERSLELLTLCREGALHATLGQERSNIHHLEGGRCKGTGCRVGGRWRGLTIGAAEERRAQGPSLTLRIP